MREKFERQPILRRIFLEDTQHEDFFFFFFLRGLFGGHNYKGEDKERKKL